MTTTVSAIKLSDGWVQVATESQNFIVENDMNNGYDLFLSLKSTVPASGTAGHRIRPGQAFPRAGCDQKAWVRTVSPENISYIVSVGVR